ERTGAVRGLPRRPVPDRLTALRIERKELSAVAVRQAEQAVSDDDAVGHVEADLARLPDVLCRPLRAAFDRLEGRQSFFETGDDDDVAVQNRRDHVLGVFGRERALL